MAKVICVATPLYPPQIGGPATHVALLQQILPSDEFQLRIVKFSSFSFLPKGIKHIVYFFAVFFRAIGADCVYALDPVSVGLPASYAASLLRKKFVLRVGGDYAWEQGTQRFGVTQTLDAFVTHQNQPAHVLRLRRIQSKVAKSAARVVAPSGYLKHIVSTWGVKEDAIEVIYSQPSSVLSMPSRFEARKSLNIHEDELVVLSSGRLVPWKGFEGLVDAVASARTHMPLSLYIAGSGPGLRSLEAHIQEREASAFVTLLGDVSHDHMLTWLAAADVYALNTKYEGLSHALLEAFAAHLPVITTAVGGNVELVEDGRTGLLVTPDDITALSAALLRVVSERGLASSLADAAYASLEKFNPEKAARQLRALFKSL